MTIEQAEGLDTDEIITDEIITDETQQDEATDTDVSDEVVAEAGDDDGVTVTIGEESPPSEEEEVSRAPEWVRELRKSHRELQREKRELEEKLKAVSGVAMKPAELGQKPTLDGCDYDAERFETELAAWYEAKRQADAEREAQEQAQREQQKAWQAQLDTYAKQKTAIKVPDFDDAELAAQETLSQVQQGIIVQGAENSALMIYALGKNPGKAKELASITDPVKFAFAVARLETQLKVTPRKTAPPPERTVSGTGPKSGAVDSELERLRADAAKTGDYSKVMQYKREKRQAA